MSKISKILIVDDVPISIKMLGELLKDDYDILVATSGSKAIEVALKNQPDLILMDVVMPEMDGLETCRQLKMNPQTVDIPVIFITAMSDSTDIIKGFVAGGQDYIVKPFNKTEVIVRVKTHIELKKAREKIKQFAMEMEQKNKELKLLLKEVKQTAMTDFLTGVSNRRNAVIMMQEELSRINRNEKPFSLIIIDVDNFKKINDSYGHECGDYVLKRIAKLICSSLRKYDMLARWGGEEFLVMLPGTNLSNARTVVQKLILCVRNSPFNYKEFSMSLLLPG